MNEERKFYRGEIYYVRYDNSVGSEEAVGRPVVLVSSQMGLDSSPVVQCVYLTTKLRQVSCAVHINSMYRRSYALCNQLNSIDKARLDKRIGKISDREMVEVDRALKEVLGLMDNKPLPQESEEVAPENDSEEVAELRVELELHKKLYEKTLEKLVELRLEKDGVTEKPVVESVEGPIEEPVEEPVVEEPELDLSGLEEKFEVHDTKKKTKTTKKKNTKKGYSHQGKSKLKEGAKPININTASKEEFESVGICKQTATQIVKWRDDLGGFTEIEDLLVVPRFGKGCLAVYGPMLEV